MDNINSLLITNTDIFNRFEIYDKCNTPIYVIDNNGEYRLSNCDKNDILNHALYGVLTLNHIAI